MHLALNDVQTMLQDAVRRLLFDSYTPERRRLAQAQANGWDSGTWARYAELGLLSIGLDEDENSTAAVEMLVVMEEMGRVAALEPVVSTLVMCGRAIKELGTAGQKAYWLPAISDGRGLLAFAHDERGDQANGLLMTTARATAGGWIVDGIKIQILDGHAASAFVVSARLVDAAAGDPIGLFLVKADAIGVTSAPYRVPDGRGRATVTLQGVLVPMSDRLDGQASAASDVIDGIQDAAALATGSQAVGAMAAMLDLTIAHLRTRIQFGVPLASFQALQHRLVDMSVALEEARSMVLYGTLMLDNNDKRARRAAVAAASLQVCRSCRLVGQQAVQLHGAIGLTEEYALAPLFLRTTLLETEFGDAERHLSRLSELGGLYSRAG